MIVRRRVTYPFDRILAAHWKRHCRIVALFFKQVQTRETSTKRDKVCEHGMTTRKPYTRIVGLQKVGVTPTVFRAVHNGVDIIKDVLRAERVVEVSGAVRNEPDADY